MGSHMHDHPLMGHATSFFSDSLGGSLGLGKMTDEEIDACFKKIDTKGQGFLDKCEIGDALRHHGKSEKEVQRFIDQMEEDQLSLEEFRAMCKGKPQKMTHDIGGVTVPNLAKVHDVPFLGGFTSAIHNTVKEGGHQVAGHALGDAWHNLGDDQLKAKFNEADEDQTGSLDAKGVAKALRKLKVQETKIKDCKDAMGDSQVNFNDFRTLVRNKVAGKGHIHDHPVLGHATGFLQDSFHGAMGPMGFDKMSEAELQTAFQKMDTKGQGFLDKGEIHDALHDHGLPDRDIDHILEGMDEETLDFEGFKQLVKGGKPQPTHHEVPVPGIGFAMPVPNVAKIHEIPVAGGITGALHKSVKGVHGTIHKHTEALPVAGGVVGAMKGPMSGCPLKGLTSTAMGGAFTSAFGKMTDAELHAKFDEIDTEKLGKLNQKEVAAALRKLKLKESDIKTVTMKIGDQLIDFEGFKALCHQGMGTSPATPGKASPMVGSPFSHDHPIGGHFHGLMADSLGDSLGMGKLSDEQIEAAFKKFDTKNQGFLDKCEIADALRHKGKTDKQVQRFIDSMDTDTLNLEDFKAMVKGTKQKPMTHDVGGVPVPNVHKIHEIPVLGGFTGAIHNTVKEGGMQLAGHGLDSFQKLSDEDLKKKFDELDEDKVGKINAKEIAKALRNLKVPETDIKQMKDQIGDSELTFPEFKALLKKNTKSAGSGHIHDHPVFGHATGMFQDCFHGALGPMGFEKMNDEQLKAAFVKMDYKGQGFLDKGEIHDALADHGLPERDIDHILEGMEEDNLDLEGFKALVRGKPQPTHHVHETPFGFSVPVPNLAKVHDIPVAGGITGALHKGVKGAAGAAHGHLHEHVSSVPIAGGVLGHASSLAKGPLQGNLVSGVTGAFTTKFGKMTDAELHKKFDEIDTEKLGKLNKSEVAAALRKLGLAEKDVTAATAAIGDDLIEFEAFKKMCHGGK
jgi:Ca2+-binding EF-hand superfamily protein